eukprot:2476901-Amphidinium_carterae.1
MEDSADGGMLAAAPVASPCLIWHPLLQAVVGWCIVEEEEAQRVVTTKMLSLKPCAYCNLVEDSGGKSAKLVVGQNP